VSIINRIFLKAGFVLMIGVVSMGLGSIAHAQNAPRATMSKVGPAYPELARRMHIEGVVKVRVHVRPDGTVATAKAESGESVFTEDAENCARKWIFMSSSHPDTFVVEVAFKLEDQ
jgi:TonB family protein